MSNLPQKTQCCGCSACKASCPRKAIKMKFDIEGFLMPSIDEQLCVHCGRCETVCPVLNHGHSRSPLFVFAVQSRDISLRKISSSGGIFSLLAMDIFSKGGVVFGAAFDQDSWSVHHHVAENEEELAKIRGSKYVQSQIDDVFIKAKHYIENGRYVLFSGTPCQIAGFRNFLGREHDKLICVDVVCHATPSQLVWYKYLQKRIAEAYCVDGEKISEEVIKNISFRSKCSGWKKFSMLIEFSNGCEYHKTLTEDSFLQAFLNELCNRPSCHDCKFKNLRSGSDITLGDYWGVHRFYSDFDDDLGTSLILINTDKGMTIWNAIKEKTVFRPSDYHQACMTNSAIFHSSEPHCNRKRFMNAVISDNDFDFCVEKYRTRSLLQKVVGRLNRLVGKLFKEREVR